MATYKGIGYDSGKYDTGNASDTVQFNGEVSSNSLNVTNNATIGGDLNVVGDIISGGSTNVVIKDPAIDLGVGATQAQSTGFSFIANEGTNANSISSISGLVITCGEATSISANDIVQISGNGDSANDGLYVVASVATPNITLSSTAYQGTLPFIQTALSSNTGGGTISNVNLKALIVAGFEKVPIDNAPTYFAEGTLVEKFATDAVLSDFNSDGSYQAVGTSATVTLQDAYDAGNSILLASSSNFDINKPTSGNASISLESNQASDFTVDGSTLTLATQNDANAHILFNSSGVVRVAGGALDIDTSVDADVSTFAVDSTSATTLTSSQAGGGAIVLNASDANGTVLIQNAGSSIVTINSSGGSVSGNWALTGNLEVDGNTTLGDATTDTITFTARASSSLIPDTDVSYDLGSSSLAWSNVYTDNMSIGGALTLATGVQNSILYVGASGEVIEDNGNLRYDGSSFEVGASGSEVFSVAVSSGNTVVNGTLDVAGLSSLNGGIAVDANFTVDGTTGAVSTVSTLNVDSTSTLGDDITLDKAGSQSIQKSASGSGQDLLISLTGANDSSILIQSAGTGNDAISISASAGDIGIESEASGKSLVMTSDFPQLARNFTAGATVVASQVAYLADSGSGVRAFEANGSAISTAIAMGVFLTGGNSNDTVRIAVNGIVTITSDESIATSDVGKAVYLSASTAGNITRSAPNSANNVVYQVGICVGGTTTSWQVALQPQFIMEIS